MLVRRGLAACVLAVALALLLSVAVWGREFLVAPENLALMVGVAALIGLGALLLPATRESPADAAAETQELAPVDDLVAMLGETLLLAGDLGADQSAQPVDVGALVANIAGRHGNVDVRRVGSRSLVVSGSNTALARAFEILIDNACNGGQQARVECDAGASAVAVHVDDNGPGIARSEREQIFNWHYYMTQPPSARPGVRAELVIARKVVRSAGGDITVGASPLGGARFSVRLPLRDVECAAPAEELLAAAS